MRTENLHYINTKLNPVDLASRRKFLEAFDRFANRRGKCENLYRDCGTNFIDSGKILKRY